jgi:hypothetical protein
MIFLEWTAEGGIEVLGCSSRKAGALVVMREAVEAGAAVNRY